MMSGWWVLLAGCFLVVPLCLGLSWCRQSPVQVRHVQSGKTKRVYVGWSWTYWYFGWLVPLFRGEWWVALRHCLWGVLTLGLFSLVGSFFYNQQQLKRCLRSGWVLDDTPEVLARVQAKLGMV